MKKSIPIILLIISSITTFAQSWVEVGVDTQFGAKFQPNDIEHLSDSLVVLAGYSYNWEDWGPGRSKNGFLKSIDGGTNWDTLYFFNSSFITGDNYQIRILGPMVFVLQGRGSNRSGTYADYNPFCLDYELNLYNDNWEYQRTIVNMYNLDSGYIKAVYPINHKTLGAVMEYPDSGYYFDNFVLLDIDSVVFERKSLPVYLESINDIQFVDSLFGYMAVGSQYREHSGYLLKTIDGGKTWNVVKDNSTSMFQCVEFYDRNIGMSSSG